MSHIIFHCSCAHGTILQQLMLSAKAESSVSLYVAGQEVKVRRVNDWNWSPATDDRLNTDNSALSSGAGPTPRTLLFLSCTSINAFLTFMPGGSGFPCPMLPRHGGSSPHSASHYYIYFIFSIHISVGLRSLLVNW